MREGISKVSSQLLIIAGSEAIEDCVLIATACAGAAATANFSREAPPAQHGKHIGREDSDKAHCDHDDQIVRESTEGGESSFLANDKGKSKDAKRSNSENPPHDHEHRIP